MAAEIDTGIRRARIKMIREDVVARLLATGKWWPETTKVAERAGYQCEYCGLDLLGSIESYKLFEIDHIVPVSKGGARADIDNLALACRHCNYHFKRSWDPRKITGENATRCQFIAAAKKYIEERKQLLTSELEEVRRIVGWTPQGL